jgi:hypothetical protein
MAYQKIKQEICSRLGVSIKETPLLACFKQTEREVKEERSFDSIKDYSKINNFNSNKPNELTILKKAREKISKCFSEYPPDSKRLEKIANARVSS